jgi:hypothetical protein
MIQLNNIGVSIDMGVIPPLNKLSFNLNNIGVSIDVGIIPPKNYFHSKVYNIGISLDKAPDSMLFYIIN